MSSFVSLLPPLFATSAPDVAPPLFVLLTLVFISIVVISLILSKFKQSLMGGYFICGALIANCGLLSSIPGANDSISVLAEIGIVLLMFCLGIEFSLDELKHLKKIALRGGSIQMGICTIAFGSLLYFVMGMPLAESLVVGAIMGLSSTAVAIKSFHEFGLSGTSGSRMALGIALFQDILAIMLVAIIPQLFAASTTSLETLSNIGLALFRGVIFLVSAWLIGKYILPRLMTAVSRTKSREIFTLSVFAICSGIAMLASMLHLSIALGAFIAGLVVSGSYYSHRVLSEVLPFRDLFLTIFFVSAGMLINWDALCDDPTQVILITAIVLIVKFISCLLAAKALNLPGKMSILASTSLTNVGEFSLVLITFMGVIQPVSSFITNNLYAIAAVSMGLTPVFMKLAVKLVPIIRKIPGFHGHRQRKMTEQTLIAQIDSLKNHAIICGYGPVGKRLHQDLDQYGIPCIIIDLNADTVKSLLNKGATAILGDIQHEITMEIAGISKAKLIAFTFPDIAPALSTFPYISSINPDITFMARAKFPMEVAKLKQEGIVNIIHDEIETGYAAIRLAHRSFDIIPEEDVPATT
ncbi:MAG: cation:proton antiporter [Akkermansia sp.]